MSVGEVCISVIDMIILASMIIVIVLVLRLLFKRAPGWIRVLLWGIVALRLIDSKFTILGTRPAR